MKQPQAPTVIDTYLSDHTLAIEREEKRIRQEMEARIDGLKDQLELSRRVAAILPSLEYTLNQLGLQLLSVESPRGTHVSITAVRKGGKFKFLTNTNRYNSQGQSTNHQARLKKARKMADFIVDNTLGIIGVFVNEFSLEVERGDTPDKIATHLVLITIQLECTPIDEGNWAINHLAQ